MTAWKFAVGQWTALPDHELTRARGRRVTWRLTGSHEASFTLDGTSSDALKVEELVSDLWVFRGGRALFRGRVGPTSDDLGADGHKVAYSVADYRAVLQRRLLFEGDTLTYPTTEQAAIGWGLISATQARNSLGIVRGVGQVTGRTRDRTYAAGAAVGEMLDNLSRVRDGFDYDIQPDARSTALTFDVFYPLRGVDRQEVLDYPGLIGSLNRQVDPAQYANSVRMTGADTLAAVRVDATDLATRPEGRWDVQVGDTDIENATTLTDRAHRELADRQIVEPAWSVTLRSGAWRGPEHIWLGDPVTLAVRSGRLNVLRTLRVQELEAAWNDNADDPTVSVVLGQVPPRRRLRVRALDRRLTTLERR